MPSNGMAIDLSYPHVEREDGQPARLRRVPRVRVAQLVMDYLAHGWSAEDLCRQHPWLQLSEAHAALLYYHDHAPEIESEIRAEWREAERDGESQANLALAQRLRQSRS